MGLIIFIKPFKVFDSKKSKSCGFPLRQVFLPAPPSRIWLHSQQAGQRTVNGSGLPWESALSNAVVSMGACLNYSVNEAS